MPLITAPWGACPRRVRARISFTDDCIYEDVTFGVVNRTNAELRAFAAGAFAAVTDIKFELISRFVAGGWEAWNG
jgi:hypothetical protein